MRKKFSNFYSKFQWRFAETTKKTYTISVTVEIILEVKVIGKLPKISCTDTD